MTDFLRLAHIREAIASVALSHEESCTCRTCKAADGDPAELAEVYEMFGDMTEPERS